MQIAGRVDRQLRHGGRDGAKPDVTSVAAGRRRRRCWIDQRDTTMTAA